MTVETGTAPPAPERPRRRLRHWLGLGVAAVFFLFCASLVWEIVWVVGVTMMGQCASEEIRCAQWQEAAASPVGVFGSLSVAALLAVWLAWMLTRPRR